MSAGWRRVTDDLQATFLVEGCLRSEQLVKLSRDLKDAANDGYRHLVLDLRLDCETSLHDWEAFAPVVEHLTRRGASLDVRGGSPDLRDGLQSAALIAQMRILEEQAPECFAK